VICCCGSRQGPQHFVNVLVSLMNGSEREVGFGFGLWKEEEE
jgi:hypothetical protein